MFVSTGADTPVLYGNPKNLVSAVFIGISAMYVPIIIKTKLQYLLNFHIKERYSLNKTFFENWTEWDTVPCFFVCGHLNEHQDDEHIFVD